MKKGASLYYASDKNIFDALNQSKVDNDTIQAMFRRRNIVCSKQTKREDLSRFFSRLTHDLLDHHDLSDRLGVVPRRERVTAVDLIGDPVPREGLQRAVNAIREKLGATGEIAHVSNSGNGISLTIKYSIIDYKKSEFNQLQQRSGILEIIPDKGKLVIRSTKSDYLDDVRDELVREIQTEAQGKLERREVSLFQYPDHTTRSQFFYDLITELPGYVRKDVIDVFVFKPRPDRGNNETDDVDGFSEPHIDRIFLRGVGISQSDLLRDLTREKAYYIAKVGWIATELLGTGAAYEVEATFSDPKDCTGFSYILRGVYDLGESGKLSKVRRSPTPSEIDAVARVVEAKARELITKLDAEAARSGAQP